MRRFALDCLVNRILSSDVLHADETAIRLHNLNDAVVILHAVVSHTPHELPLWAGVSG